MHSLNDTENTAAPLTLAVVFYSWNCLQFMTFLFTNLFQFLKILPFQRAVCDTVILFV